MQQDFLDPLIGSHGIFMEFIQEGVIAVLDDLKPIYINSKAREICQQFWGDYYHSSRLPPLMSEIAHQLINNSKSKNREIAIIDYKTSEEQIIRVRAHDLSLQLDLQLQASQDISPQVIIFLQDRCAILQEELRIEKQKYNLSDRETQILRLLQQTCTYQEIAKALQISLNTVKFHVKNIYAKKRSCLEQEKIYFEIQNKIS